MALDRAVTRTRLIDVAQAAGVSRSVAGHILLGSGKSIRVSEPTTKRVREAARRLDYKPNQIARQLRGIRSQIVGALLGVDRSRIGYDLLAAVEREVDHHSLRLMIGQVRDGKAVAEYLDDFQARGIDGLIYLDFPVPDEVKERLAAMPVVFNTKPDIEGACYVEVDRAEGIRQAVRHLLRQGKRRPALLLSDMHWRTSLERLRGFQEELAAQGITPEPDWVRVTAVRGEVMSRAQADAEIDLLVIGRHADALIVNNDNWGVSIIKALNQRRIAIPDQVAVVGFNNIDVSTACEPELTTIDQQHGAFARAAVNLLQKLIQTGSVPPAERAVIVPPLLIPRQSS